MMTLTTKPDEALEPSSSAKAARRLHLGYTYAANGVHPAGWRYPGASFRGALDIAHVSRLAQIAESAAFDFFLFGDGTPETPRLEPFTTAAYLATATRHIGLVATADTAYCEPFNLARLAASLDHVTHGRASWNIAADIEGHAASQYSREKNPDTEPHHERADEFVTIVRKLWDSWEDDAFIRNKDTGEFIDGGKIHAIDHKGKAFSVKGPLNVARPPQGQLVVLHAGTSDRSRDFSAREADVVFSEAAHLDDGLAYRVDLRARAQAHGRDPDTIRVLTTVTPIVGATLEEARRIHDELNSLLVLDQDIRFGGRDATYWASVDEAAFAVRDVQGAGWRNLAALSRRVGVELTNLELDAALAGTAAGRFNAAGAKLLSAVVQRTGRTIEGARPVTIRDLLDSHIVGGHVIVGGPVQIADYFQSWLDRYACDGFNIQSAFVVDQLLAFSHLVVPELRRRGIFRQDYDGATLRDHLALRRPLNRWAA
jgi:FMN-dependent oxidoreductase (nitrilotriacetate monooxygenase family)